MKKTGKVPMEGLITLDCKKEEAWSLLMGKIINTVPHSAHIPYKEDILAKIDIIITEAMGAKMANGVLRSRSTALNHLCKKAWYLFGYIEGAVPKSICIVYFLEINMSFYSIMEEKEDPKKFFNVSHN